MTPLTVRFAPDLLAALQAYAAQHRVSLEVAAAELIRMSLGIDQ